MRVRLRAFTLIELIITIAIMMMLAALVFVVIGPVIEKEHQVICLSNLHQIWSGLMLYKADNGGDLPIVPERELINGRYVRDWNIFYCPNDPQLSENRRERRPSYAYAYIGSHSVSDPSARQLQLHILHEMIIRDGDFPLMVDDNHMIGSQRLLGPQTWIVLRLNGRVEITHKYVNDTLDI